MFSEKDLQEILKNPLFSESAIETVKSVFRQYGCRAVGFSDGEIILAPQNEKKAAGVILDGRAVVRTPNPTHKALLRFLDRGSMFGIANLFSDEPYISEIRAHGNCRVFMIPEEAIRHLLEHDSAFLYRYLAFLSGRIRFLNRKIGYLTAGSAERRLALYLVSLGRDSVRLDASISSLSELLDVGRASLYRAFDRLTEDGFLLKDGRNITLLDADSMLRAYQ